jgi:hypothetical protein
MYNWRRPSMFIRDIPNFSSERVLHKDYDRKGSVAKNKKQKTKTGRELQEVWRQD